MTRTTGIVGGAVWGVMALGCVERSFGDAGESSAMTGGETVESGASTSASGGPTPTSGEASSGSPGSVSEPDPSAGTVTGESGESAASSETGFNFIVEHDGGIVEQCDVWAQDCPEGHKCSAWASDGGNAWNATRCVAVTGDQKPGEPCVAPNGGVSGEDDCIKGAMCWDVDVDKVGFCVALCTGSPDAPVCEDGGWCAVTGEGVINICLPNCDALLQDCPGDDLCLPIDDTFVCVLDASGDEGQAFDPCEFANACDPGLVCAGSESASECDPLATGCCVPMCSISGMMACPGVGQECASLYEEGMAPPQFEDIGFCTLPP